jgi:hypothetical protein
MKRSGFALATTLVLLGLVMLSTTTVLVMLSRSLKMTRVHTEALRTFYVAEGGKAYAMWKLSPLNNGADATQLANCLAQNETCPGGLNQSWSYALPGDAASNFAVTVVSSATAGEAQIESRGTRSEGALTARRRTKITAFKPIRQLDENDQAYDYAILTEGELSSGLLGDLRVAPAADQPERGIHANGDMWTLAGRLRVQGPISAQGTLVMPFLVNTPFTEVSGTTVRAANCGWLTCDSLYNQAPQYCWGSSCEGFVGNISLPGIDINSNRADSYKNVAKSLDTQFPADKHFYTNSELEKAMDDAYKKNLNGGWVDVPGPITYVSGDFRIAYGNKLRVHGVLVVQGNLRVGYPDRSPYALCVLLGCPSNVELVVDPKDRDNNDVVTGLIVSGSVDMSLFIKNVSVNGLLYAMKGLNVSCTLSDPVVTQGVILARSYTNSAAPCNGNWQTEGLHNHYYDTTRLHLLFQGARAITDISTTYTGHWEEEY